MPLLNKTEVVTRLTANLDLGSSAGALQDVTDLSIALQDGQQVCFTFICSYTNGANIGIQFGVNYTGTSGTLTVGTLQGNSTTAWKDAGITALNTVIFAETAGSTTPNTAIISGCFIATGAGTFLLRACNEGSGACVLNSGSAALFTTDLWNNDSTTVTDVPTLLLTTLFIAVNDATTVTDYTTLPFYILLGATPVNDATTATDALAITGVMSLTAGDDGPAVTDASTVVLVAQSSPQPNTGDDAPTVTDASTVLLTTLVPTAGDDTTVTDASPIFWLITIVGTDTTAVDDASPLFVTCLFVEAGDDTTASERLQMAIPLPPLPVTGGDDTTADDLALALVLLNFAANDAILADDAVTCMVMPPPLEVTIIEHLTAVGGALDSLTTIT